MKKDIQKIENIQKTFTRILFYRAFPDPHYPQSLPSYQTRLQHLNLKSLYYRRIQSDLILAFKILKGEVRLKPSKYWIFRPSYGRRGGFFSIALKMGLCRINVSANSFFSRTMRWLSRFPHHVMACENSKQFKRALRKTNILQVIGESDVE